MKNLIVLASGVIFLVCGGQKPEKSQVSFAPQETAVSETPPLVKTETIAPQVAPEQKPVAPPEKVEPKEKPEEEKVATEKPAELPKLWDFFATWCPPCKRQAPIVEEISREFEGKVEVRSIDTDQEPELARQFNIQAVPTLVFIDASGKELSRNVGLMSKEEILARFKKHGFIE